MAVCSRRALFLSFFPRPSLDLSYVKAATLPTLLVALFSYRVRRRIKEKEKLKGKIVGASVGGRRWVVGV